MLQSGSFLDGQEDAKTGAEALECANLFPVAGVRAGETGGAQVRGVATPGAGEAAAGVKETPAFLLRVMILSCRVGGRTDPLAAR